jgi:pyruvate/2-oxoglutarate dehydrogenase complex dihydrolipoamide dehydrogenase (E3) component
LRSTSVRTRTQSSLDITASFVAPRDRLQEARAERQALLRALAKADTVNRLMSSGGRVRVSCEVAKAEYEGGSMALTLTDGARILAAYVIVQIGFLSAKETFQRLDVRLNEDSSIAIDPYFETSRRGIFAVGDVHGDIKLVTVAWAEGIQAAIYAFKEITSPYWLNEKRLRDQKIAMIGDKITQAARVKAN